VVYGDEVFLLIDGPIGCSGGGGTRGGVREEGADRLGLLEGEAGEGDDLGGDLEQVVGELEGADRESEPAGGGEKEREDTGRQREVRSGGRERRAE
jgi:hypothetical protein